MTALFDAKVFIKHSQSFGWQRNPQQRYLQGIGPHDRRRHHRRLETTLPANLEDSYVQF